ncbi:MAG: CAP domain-containing protein, partial [Oscillospiraceae bacterium]|nr:CAP domain-containing protein [Oscillospiraceae bacterium]
MFKKFVSLFLSVACIVAFVGTGFMKPYQAYAQEDFSAEIEAVLDLVNEQREAVGAEPLALDESLTEAAMIRAEEIVESFSHTRPDGSSCFTVLDELGISCGYPGENIAAGYSDAADVMNGWVNSEGHYKNIVDKYYSEIGIGIVYDSNSEYGYYWVQIFADYTEPIYTTPAVTTSVNEGSEVEMSTSAVTLVSRTQTNVSGETKKTEVSVATSVSNTETEETNVTKTSEVETVTVYVTETTSCSSTTTTTSATTATTTTRMFTDLYTVYTSFALNLHYMYSYCDYDDTTFTFVTPSDAVRVTRIPVYGLYTCNENGECTLISTTEGEHEVSYYSFNSWCYVTDCEYDSPSDMYDKLFRGKESDYYDGYAYTTMAVTISAPGLSNSNYYAEVRMSLPNVEQTTTTSATTTTTTTYASTALVTKPSLTTATSAVTSKTATEKYIVSSAVITALSYKEISYVNVVAENQNYTYQDTEYNLDDVYLEIKYKVIYNTNVIYYYSDGTSYTSHTPSTSSYYESEIIEADSSWEFAYSPAEYYEKYADYDEDIEVKAYFECYLSEYDEYIDEYIPITISGPEATTAVSTTDVSKTTTTVTTTENPIVSSTVITSLCEISIYDI